MYAVVIFLKTVWDSHGVFYFRSRISLFQTANQKKFELIQKSYVPRALRFSCQGPSRLREAKRAMGTRMAQTKKGKALGTRLISGNGHGDMPFTRRLFLERLFREPVAICKNPQRSHCTFTPSFLCNKLRHFLYGMIGFAVK